MKSRVSTYTRKEIGRVCEDVSREVDKCVNSNGLVFLIALARHAGWKKKRLESFIITLNETMDEFHRHSIDGVFDIMAERELSEIGIEMEQVLPEPIPFAKQLRKSKLEKTPHITVAEAKKMRDELAGFSEFFKENENGKEK